MKCVDCDILQFVIKATLPVRAIASNDDGFIKQLENARSKLDVEKLLSNNVNDYHIVVIVEISDFFFLWRLLLRFLW